MAREVRWFLLGLALTAAPLAEGDSAAASGAQPVCYRGVNLSGAEFGEPGGAYGTNYIYPSEETVRYFAKKGMNTVRLPFRWERLQPRLKDRLDGDELQRLTDTVALIRKYKMTVVLDPHNYAVYGKDQIGKAPVTVLAFADFWARLAVEFANQDGVIFGLMNEPHDMPADAWLRAANAAIRSIRAVGAKNLILVPGTNWTGAHSWQTDMPGGANATVMLDVKDPRNNFAFDVHQYFDEDFSGTHPTCSKADGALDAINRMTVWLREHKQRAFLGEFGVSQDDACLAGLKQVLDAIQQNGDVWLGWTYWAGGDWWAESEPLNVQPHGGRDRKQMAALIAAANEPAADAKACGTIAK
ncbi:MULTISPECIES: glycoside hydrolase family 5 protein [unclassified Sinorhizobium]|uniref:glycoside hydrolase family 5 protein n=1 Tax=unclassified Sinorhizobium TaxID=2613772 RepID=UPI003526675E